MTSYTDSLNSLRKQLFDRGSEGTAGLSRVFRIADDNGNQKLDLEEFEETLGFSGLFLKTAETKQLFQYFDKDDSGQISLTEFLAGLQGKMNDRRAAMVAKAFAVLDIDNSGSVTYDDVKDIYSAKDHPKVMTGEKTEQEVIETFLDGFDGVKGNNDGMVTKEEFTSYYDDVSATTPSDEYFVTMMQNCWKISENPVDASELDKLEKMLYESARQKSNGTSEPKKKVQQVFNHFDEDESGRLTINEFGRALERFGLCLAQEQLRDFFKRYDKNGDGTLDIQEFSGCITE